MHLWLCSIVSVLTTMTSPPWVVRIYYCCDAHVARHFCWLELFFLSTVHMWAEINKVALHNFIAFGDKLDFYKSRGQGFPIATLNWTWDLAQALPIAGTCGKWWSSNMTKSGPMKSFEEWAIVHPPLGITHSNSGFVIKMVLDAPNSSMDHYHVQSSVL